MSKSLSYADAVKLLGAEDSKLVNTLDFVTSGMLLAASASGIGIALSLFEAKDQLVRLSNKLISGIASKLDGLGRLERTERIAAAHAIIVLTAYFEALGETEDELAKPPKRNMEGIRTTYTFDPVREGEDEDDAVLYEVYELITKMRKQRMTKAKQIELATSQAADSSKLRAVAFDLLHSGLPIPSPQLPYEKSIIKMQELYFSLTHQLVPLLVGVDRWEPLKANVQNNLRQILTTQVPNRAVKRYESLLQSLASDFPEVGYWANLIDHQATRASIEEIRIALTGLRDTLSLIACGRIPDDRRQALSRFYQAALDRQIVETGEVPTDSVKIPVLGTAYVNPNFKVASVDPSDRPDLESWWDQYRVNTDIQGFLIGFFTSPEARSTPLVVLGQPGSGKSVLTKVLSARLPANQFLTIRVVLREVPADADIQTQIEYSVRDATAESISWPDLARTAPDSLRVILLDGFDELIQATGVSQSDYLEKVTRFQEREAIQGRPVAVIVTSRTAVADRARIPAEGVVCIRLEPFSDEQVGIWVSEWNRVNRLSLEARGLMALNTEVALAQAELASQPLLLLMLALYDADKNALQQADKDMSHAQLYEQLLGQFAEREVRKERPELDDQDLRREVENQLLRLSIAGFAMFNRGRQWATQTELDADLVALILQNGQQSSATSFRAPLSAAQLVMGQFFFIHQAQAVRDGNRSSAFEFLHATFGEYLVARIVANELRDIAVITALATDRSRYAPPDDSYLHALLSFAPLSARATIMDYMSELLAQMPTDNRTGLSRLLIQLFRSAFDDRIADSYSGYEPISLDILSRLAMYSANLLLLVVTAAGGVAASDLFPDSEDVVASWRRVALLWRAALPQQGWSWLASSLDQERTGPVGQRDIVISLLSAKSAEPSRAIDLYWTYDETPTEESGLRPRLGASYLQWRSEARFVADLNEDVVAHSLDPLVSQLSSTITTSASCPGGRCISAAHALIRLWLASTTGASTDELTAAYEDCIAIALFAFEPFDSDAEGVYRKILVHLLSADVGRLPGSWRDKIRKWLISEGENSDDKTFVNRVIVKLGFRLM